MCEASAGWREAYKPEPGPGASRNLASLLHSRAWLPAAWAATLPAWRIPNNGAGRAYFIFVKVFLCQAGCCVSTHPSRWAQCPTLAGGPLRMQPWQTQASTHILSCPQTPRVKMSVTVCVHHTEYLQILEEAKHTNSGEKMKHFSNKTLSQQRELVF